MAYLSCHVSGTCLVLSCTWYGARQYNGKQSRESPSVHGASGLMGETKHLNRNPVNDEGGTERKDGGQKDVGGICM